MDPFHLGTDGLRQKNWGQKDFPIQVSRYHLSAPDFSVINFSVRFLRRLGNFQGGESVELIPHESARGD
jgi:hypothetical protein